MVIRAKEIGSRVVAMKPVTGSAEWLRYNLSLNVSLGVTQVLEVALGNECGQVGIVLADDFIAGSLVGNATFGSPELHGPKFPRTMVSARRSIGFGMRNCELISSSSTLKATRQSSRKVAAGQSQRTGQCFS
jgi:hypothetical protein